MQDRWKIALKGDSFALRILAWNLPSGDVRALKEDEVTFLVAPRIDLLDSLHAVRITADEMLANVNIAFSILHTEYSSVEAEGTVIEREADGSERLHVPSLTATMDLNVRFGVLGIHRGQPTTPSLSELALTAIEHSEHLRAAVLAFNAKPTNFGDLFIAYETLCRSFSAQGKSSNKQEIITLGWATQKELSEFGETANYYRHGLPRKPVKSLEMPLEEAAGLIRRLLVHWAERLGAEPPVR